MRIVHCCLSFEYVDDLAYQENILPYMHKKLGHEVTVIASTIVARVGMQKYAVQPGKYTMKNGVEMIRLQTRKLPYFLQDKLHIHKPINGILEELKPDLIFVHELNSLSIIGIDKYVRSHPSVHFVVDNHNDYYNSGRNWISLNLLHRGVYSAICKRIRERVDLFWGTLPIRCEFLEKIYLAPKDKIFFLPMGIDDSNVDYTNKTIIRATLRKKLGFNDDDIIVVFGGKIDANKHVSELIEAVNCLSSRVKLLIFGKPSPEFKKQYNSLIENNSRVTSVGWIHSEKVYDYFFCADIACFPGGHSVLWEQAVACGLPSVFLYHEGMNHVDLGGNCLFINESTSECIVNAIESILKDDIYVRMKTIAEEKGRSTFSYHAIAKYSLSKLEGLNR